MERFHSIGAHWILSRSNTFQVVCSKSISSNKLLLRLCHLFRGHVLQTADNDGTCPMRLISGLQDLVQNVTRRGLIFLGIIGLICSVHVGVLCIKDSEGDDVSPCNLDTLVLWGLTCTNAILWGEQNHSRLSRVKNGRCHMRHLCRHQHVPEDGPPKGSCPELACRTGASCMSISGALNTKL